MPSTAQNSGWPPTAMRFSRLKSSDFPAPVCAWLALGPHRNGVQSVPSALPH